MFFDAPTTCGRPRPVRRALSALPVLLLVAVAATAAPPDRFHSDRPGGSDHPALSRYKGSMLYMYGSDNVGSAQVLVAGKGKPVYLAVEGRVNNRLYWGPKDRSALEIYRNYVEALRAAGYETLFACETAQCEPLGVQQMVREFPRRVTWKASDSITESTFNGANQPLFHYLSARKTGPNGPLYVQLALVGSSASAPLNGRVRQFLQIIEPAPVEQGNVSAIDAGTIQRGLQQDGKMVFHGVLFDTNQAVIKPESGPQLDEMAKALKAVPALTAFVVGHTDNQGKFEANLLLSQKRAQAVVDALTARHGVAAGRLSARGVASLAPLVSNQNDDGRANNRRVEFVVR
jgi:outer membrane protein OmpA-like peptidoglycan-associated protein